MPILIERQSYVAWQWSQFMACLTFLRLDIQVSSQLCYKHFANSLMDAQAPCHIYWIIFHEGGVWQGKAEAQASVQFSSVAQSCPTLCNPMNRTQHARPPCPSPTPGVQPNSCPLSWWCHPPVSSSVVPFSFCPQSFPASGSFQMSQLFTSGGQSIGVSASASVLSMNTQDWSPLEWTGWISLQSKHQYFAKHPQVIWLGPKAKNDWSKKK